MAIAVENYPPFRECHFCLCLQKGSVFADFDVDKEGLVFLRRISFDGYGCCNGDFNKMKAEDSRRLIDSVERGSLAEPQIEELLRTYLEKNSNLIWRDALTDHELV
jgi:hypothetical protein